MNARPFILLALAAALFFFKLGDFSLYDAIETIYGEFVKQILLTGDWLTLHFNGQVIFDKPPLYYWLAAALAKLVGLSELALRLPAALAGVLTVLATYALGKTFHNERTGFLSGLIAMTAFQFLIQSRIAELDIVLTLFMTLAIYLFYLGYRSGERKFYLLAYLPLALGLLVKGLLAAALPGFAVFLFLLFKKELPKLKEMRVIPGIIIICLIGLPWYAAEYLIHGKVFLDFALGFLFLSRFQGVVAGHTGPWYYYFLALILGFAPWSHLLPLGLWRAWKLRTQDPELLTLCFILPAFIVFSIAQTKIPNYILPLYPFLAIMVGKLWDDLLTEGRKPAIESRSDRDGFLMSSFLLVIIVILIFIGITIAGRNYAGPYQALIPNLLLLGGVLIAGTLCSIFFAMHSNFKFSFYSLPAMVFIITFILTTQTLPAVEKFKGTKELAGEVGRVIKPGEIIAAYNIGNRPGVVFYNARPILFIDNEKEAIAFIKGHRGYCFTHISEVNALGRFGKIFGQKGELAVII